MKHISTIISVLAAIGLFSPTLLHAQAARLSLEQLPPVYVVAEPSAEIAARGCQLQTFNGETRSFLVSPETPYPVVPADADTGQDDGQAEIFFCSREAVDSLTVLGQVSGLVDRIVEAIGKGFAKLSGVVGGTISKIVGVVLSTVLTPFAALMVFFMSLVAMGSTYFLAYGTFLTNPVVRAGWPFVLGFANLGFVLALLFIALSTVLRIEGFQARRMLPRLLIAALLINFSLIIAVFILDASRLVMAVLAQSIADNAQCTGSAIGCLPANVLKNSQLVTAAFNIHGDQLLVASPGVFGGKVPGIVDTLQALVIIALITLAFMVLFALLAVRWLALIILLVLSPLAYLFVALPGTSQWARMWWEKFIKYVIYGPVIVLILALFTQAQGPLYQNLQDSFDDLNVYANGQQIGNTGSTIASVLMTGITAAFLIGSVAAGQYLGGMAGAVAKNPLKSMGAAYTGTMGAAERVPGLGQLVTRARTPERFVRGYWKGREEKLKQTISGQEKPGIRMGRGKQKREISEEDIQKAELDERVREFARQKARGEIKPEVQFDDWNAKFVAKPTGQPAGMFAAVKGKVADVSRGLAGVEPGFWSRWTGGAGRAARRATAAQQQEVAAVAGANSVTGITSSDQLLQPHAVAAVNENLAQSIMSTYTPGLPMRDNFINTLASLPPEQANQVDDATLRVILQNGSQQEVQKLASNQTLAMRVLSDNTSRAALNDRRNATNMQAMVDSANKALEDAGDTTRFGVGMGGGGVTRIT